MILSFEIPDAIARQLHLDGPQGSRRALQLLALAGYRAGDLSRGQVSALLDMEFNETEGFLKESKMHNPLTVEEFQRNSEALEKLIKR